RCRCERAVPPFAAHARRHRAALRRAGRLGQGHRCARVLRHRRRHQGPGRLDCARLRDGARLYPIPAVAPAAAAGSREQAARARRDRGARRRARLAAGRPADRLRGDDLAAGADAAEPDVRVARAERFRDRRGREPSLYRHPARPSQMSPFRASFDRSIRTALAIGLAVLAASPALVARAAEISGAEIRDGVYLFQGAGSNVIVLVDGGDLLIIDGGLQEHSAELYAAIRETTGGTRIDTLINTHWHPEQVGLNALAAADGATIIAHEQTHMYLSHPVSSALFDGYFGPLDEAARPNEYGRDGGRLTFGGT